MDDVRQMIFDSMSETLFIDETKFHNLIDGWTLTPEYTDGKLYGVVMTKGPELHFVSNGQHDITRQTIRKHLQPLIEQYGYACTRAPKKDVRQARFNKILGFEKYDEDHIDAYYRITHLKGSKSCQQSQ